MTVRHRITAALLTALTATALSACAATNSDGEPGATGTPTPSTSINASDLPTSAPPGIATGEPTPGTSPATAQAVVVQRSGGIAGLMATLAVEPDGSWVYGTGKDAKTSQMRGTLTPAQVQQLAALVASPQLASEQSKSKPAGVCNDTFLYKITAGSSQYLVDDCYKTVYPAAFAVVSFLSANTAL